jgi:hypothetical protein
MTTMPSGGVDGGVWTKRPSVTSFAQPFLIGRAGIRLRSSAGKAPATEPMRRQNAARHPPTKPSCPVQTRATLMRQSVRTCAPLIRDAGVLIRDVPKRIRQHQLMPDGVEPVDLPGERPAAQSVAMPAYAPRHSGTVRVQGGLAGPGGPLASHHPRGGALLSAPSSTGRLWPVGSPGRLLGSGAPNQRRRRAIEIRFTSRNDTV